ncbi:MAG TPA: hypothetical protein VG890_12350 [Puia sp.]|nr:hypothetical protein [Puia sp.]
MTTISKSISRKKPLAKRAKKRTVSKDIAASYNELKTFEGKAYSGMKIGRSHHWHYDAGDWKETKITPDLWEISYAVTKRRVGHAPEGSGVPVGTGYHWYILAHQNVFKLNANDYSTVMSGLKYKVAHKRAAKNKWSSTAPTQRKHLARFLKEMANLLEKEPIPVEFDYNNQAYQGEAVPVPETCSDGLCEEFDITLNDEHFGIIRRMKSGWKMDGQEDKKLIQAIGNALAASGY